LVAKIQSIAQAICFYKMAVQGKAVGFKAKYCTIGEKQIAGIINSIGHLVWGASRKSQTEKAAWVLLKALLAQQGHTEKNPEKGGE